MKIQEVTIKSGSNEDGKNLKAFMDEIKEGSFVHPLLRDTRMIAFKTPDEMVSFSVEPDGFNKPIVYLTSVMATPPRHGTGTTFMKWLCEVADKHHIAIKLTVQPFGRNAMPEAFLKKWYGRFGFEPVRAAGMLRPAR